MHGRRPRTVRRPWKCGTYGPDGVLGAERSHSPPWNRRDPSRHRRQRPRGAALGAPVAARPISVKSVKWRSVERKSEEVVVAMIGADNITVRSEGPLAGWRMQQPRPSGRGASRSAWAGGQPEWRRGMRPVDCPGESRMRENLMSGLGRGSRRRGSCHRACCLLHVCPAKLRWTCR